MKNTSSWMLALAIAAAGVLSDGCALSRSEVKLSAPAATPTAPTGGPVVVIRSVRDERVFEQAPHDPGTPSLGGDGANAASAEVKARAIARKRNGYGQALGDVLLEPGKTVEGVVRENLTAALRKAGYDVREPASAGPSPIFVDVRIRKFWAWLTPGFWAMTLRSSIDTDLAISGDRPAVNVSVTAQDTAMAAGDSAWIEVVDKALQLYREQAAAKTSGLR